MGKLVVQKLVAVLIGTIVGTAVGITLEYGVDKYLLHQEANFFDGTIRVFCTMLVTATFVAVFLPRWYPPKKKQ